MSENKKENRTQIHVFESQSDFEHVICAVVLNRLKLEQEPLNRHYTAKKSVFVMITTVKIVYRPTLKPFCLTSNCTVVSFHQNKPLKPNGCDQEDGFCAWNGIVRSAKEITA